MKKNNLTLGISLFVVALLGYFLSFDPVTLPKDLPAFVQHETIDHQCDENCSHATIDKDEQARVKAEKDAVVTKTIIEIDDATLAYSNWQEVVVPPTETIQDNVKAPAESRKVKIQEGIDLAIKRKEGMLILMKMAPEEALKRAVSWDEYLSLPEEVKPHFEVPFSSVGNFDVLPNCGTLDGENKHFLAANYMITIHNKHYDSSGYGRRLMIGSKQNTPLQGIHLDGVAVLRSSPLQKLSMEEAKVLIDRFPAANNEISRDISTGEVIVGMPTVALGGGKLFYFSTEAELDATNQKLEKLDELPGPHSGAQTFFLQASGIDNNANSVDWSAIEYSAQLQASAWTETEKKVFFIRVDFSDNTGESTSQAILEGVMNTTVSDSIRDMSYGKTWITADVSSMVVRLPSPTTTYLPSNNSQLRDDAIAAFNALNTGINLGDYDIVGVHFKSIGMASSGGVIYAGLAGSSRQWLQGTTSARVIIHEFGHNYGLGHARFWDTGGTTVVGAGATVEYGNNFDIMGSGPEPKGHFHPQAKAKLNWLETTDWADAAVTGSATYRLYRSDNKYTTGMRGIRVPKDVGMNHFYWIGYRRSFTDNNYLQNGIVMNWERSGISWLLDTTPGSAQDKFDSAVLIGQTYSDSVAGVHITPTAQGGASPDEWIDVTVNMGNYPGNSAPTATLTGPSSGDARSPLQFTVSASDIDGDTLAYSWNLGDGVTINNQSTITHSWTLGGTYNVSVTVSDMKGGTVTKSMTVTITDALTNWTIGSVGTNDTMSEASYINGRYILTGHGYAYFSIDGINWSRSLLSTNFRSGGIAYGNGKYVITGWDWINSSWKATAFYSEGGKQWTRANVPLIDYMDDVAFGNGRFVAVGKDGANMYSTDGINWTAGTSIGTQSKNAVAYANGEFITVGGNTVHASTNGITWSDRSGSTGLASWQSFRDIHYANGKLYAGGWYSGIRYSTDNGVTWTSAIMPTGVNYDITAIHSRDGLTVAAAVRKSDDAPVLLVSVDGVNWKEATPANFKLTNTMTYGNGVFLATQGAGEIQYSGTLFPANQPPVASISGNASVMVRQSTIYNANSNDPDGDTLTHIWDFQDGTDVATGATVTHSFPVGGVYNVKLTVLDGKGGIATDTLAVTVSDPLNNWTQLASGTTADLFDIAYGNGKLVAVGSGSGSRGAYRVSSDAITWSGGVLGGNIHFKGITFDGTKFIAVGYDYDFSIPAWVGIIYTSPDGLTWTRRNFGGQNLRDVAYGNGIYLATGDAGSILHSTDGITWNAVSSGVTSNLQAVNFGDGGFVIVGANSNGQGATVLTSNDGLAWTNTSSAAGTGQGLYHLEYANDRFLASGFHSRLRYSTDSGATLTDTGAGNVRTPAMSFGNGIYFAAGKDLGNSNARINLISQDAQTWNNLTTTATTDRNSAIFFQNTFITVGGAGEIWRSDPIPALTGWTIWQKDQFPGLPAKSGPEDDFDSDGVSNLFEYINGTDPKDNKSFENPQLIEEAGYMTMTVNKAPGVNGFTLIIQSSVNLNSWNTSDVTILTDDSSKLKVRFNKMSNDSTLVRQFLRAKATVFP